MREDRSFQRGAVWAVIIGGHVLLLVLFSRSNHRPLHVVEQDSDPRSILFFPALPEPLEASSPARQEPQSSAATDTPAAVRPPDTAITPPAEIPAAASPIDWFSEAQQVARAAAERAGQPTPRAFGQIPQSPYKTCKKKRSSFEWDPEPKRAGFIGVFPYVQVGKRCVISLGFFGCALGELPPPNSHLFDDMHAPKRPTSSVPQLDECAE
jgi:hypothetical protein